MADQEIDANVCADKIEQSRSSLNNVKNKASVVIKNDEIVR